MSGDKILFVDDESNLLDGMRNQFRKRFDVWTATSGAEALQILAENDPPFSVVDYDALLFSGVPPDQATEMLARKTGVYNPSI